MESPLHMVAKSDREKHLCGLSIEMQLDRYYISCVQDLTTQLVGCKDFSKGDLVQRCNQIPFTLEDIHKMAMTALFELSGFIRMPFGIGRLL